MTSINRPRRSALYLPAANAKAVTKARTVPADVIILDLEDSVAPELKAEARAAAVAAVHEGGFGGREVVIRANGIDTEWGMADLAAIAASGADAVLVPKVSSAGDIARYQEALTSAHAPMKLWAMIETCACIPRLHDIAAMAAHTRLSLFVMGVNDLAKEMRAQLAPGAHAVPAVPVDDGGGGAGAWGRGAGWGVQRVPRSGCVSQRGGTGAIVRFRRQDANPSRSDRAVQ